MAQYQAAATENARHALWEELGHQDSAAGDECNWPFWRQNFAKSQVGEKAGPHSGAEKGAIRGTWMRSAPSATQQLKSKLQNAAELECLSSGDFMN